MCCEEYLVCVYTHPKQQSFGWWRDCDEVLGMVDKGSSDNFSISKLNSRKGWHPTTCDVMNLLHGFHGIQNFVIWYLYFFLLKDTCTTRAMKLLVETFLTRLWTFATFPLVRHKSSHHCSFIVFRYESFSPSKQVLLRKRII
jgi:hypothetical protein